MRGRRRGGGDSGDEDWRWHTAKRACRFGMRITRNPVLIAAHCASISSSPSCPPVTPCLAGPALPQYSRRGGFERIYPTPHNAALYAPFFDGGRLNDRLLAAYLRARWAATCGSPAAARAEAAEGAPSGKHSMSAR